MVRRLLFVLTLLLLIASSAVARELTSAELLNFAWPAVPVGNVQEIGRGIGVVFSPDLSVANNCRFYEAIGFACFQEADWNTVLDQIHQYNLSNPDRRISTLVLETHGTNGNGLKLQGSYDPRADRSYIAVGALQQRLARDGIYDVIISACNSGRLLRPYIRNAIDRYNGDKLFLPATCGIIDASPDFDGDKSPVLIIRPASSHIETTLVGNLRELAPATRAAVLASARARHITLPKQFAVSDIMMQMITRDPRLQLVSNSYVDDLSGVVQPVDRSEELFRHFLTFLNAVAARQRNYLPARSPQISLSR